MNPQAAPQARPMLDVALFSFAEEFATDPRQALVRLHLLMLDEDTCLARVALLHSLADLAGRQLPQRSPAEVLIDYQSELRLVRDEGLLAAHAAGRLTPETVRRLDRLSCDTAALREVHRQLVEEDPPDSGETLGDDLRSRIGIELQSLIDEHGTSPDDLPGDAEVTEELYARLGGTAAATGEEKARFFEAAGLELLARRLAHAEDTVHASQDATWESSQQDLIRWMRQAPEVVAEKRQRAPGYGRVYALNKFAGRGEAEIADWLGLSLEAVLDTLRSEKAEIESACR